MKTLFGIKGNMSQAFVEGFRIPVTNVCFGPCVVTQIKTSNKDGYSSIQLGLGERKEKNTKKPLQGHLNKNEKIKSKEKKYPRFIKEVKIEKEAEYKIGDVIKVEDIFNAGDVISVTGFTKGKGFAGGVRRYNFRGGPKTHGQSDRHRAPGSIGQTTTPGRVYRGKRMAGRMGNTQITVKNLHVISVDQTLGTMLVSGAIPGRIGSLVTINKIKAGSLKDLEHEKAHQVVEVAEAKETQES